MRRLLATIVLLLAFSPIGHAQESVGDKAKEAKDGAAKTTDTVADGAREVGNELKVAAHKVRRAVFTRCADGRHTIKGQSGCNGHGGVSPQN